MFLFKGKEFEFGVTPPDDALSHVGVGFGSSQLDPVQNLVSIDRLIQEELNYLPRLLPIVGGLDRLLALVRTAFELVVEICTNSTNEY